jgi:hypothetical protein
MTIRALFAIVAIAHCTPPPQPVTPPTDASDAAQPSCFDSAPPPTLDAAPVPLVPCQAACDALNRLCGPQTDACVRTWAHIESAHERRRYDGQPATCSGVSEATTKAAMRAAGATCP